MRGSSEPQTEARSSGNVTSMASHGPTARGNDAAEGAVALKQESQRVGWVERSDTHQMVFMPRWVSQRAQSILRAAMEQGRRRGAGRTVGFMPNRFFSVF
jgi:ribonucleoside-diphosphate reductase alpha chain